MSVLQFVDELAALDARETRARYAAVLTAARARAGTGRWADERLQRRVATAEANVMSAVRFAIAEVEAAMAWVDPNEGKTAPVTAFRPTRAAMEDFVEEEPEEVEPRFDCRGCGESYDPYEATPTPFRPDLPPLCINCSHRS